jgi:uncharacterized protein (DUF885 family)
MSYTTSTQPDISGLADEFLDEYFTFYPTEASMLGLHDYDGRIVDMREEAIQERINRLQYYRTLLKQIDTSTLDRLARFDYDLMYWKIEAELWQWTEEREYTYNPMVYASNVIVDDYVKRDYAPLNVRAIVLTQHLRQVTEAMAVARHNLNRSLARVLVEESLTVFEGLVKFIRQDISDMFSVLDDQAILHELWAARDDAVAALDGFCIYMRDDLLPAAHDNFALGAERFSGMLRYKELVDMPLEQLLEIGETNLAYNQARLLAVADEIDPHRTVREQLQEIGRDHPAVESLLDETRTILDDLRAFLREHDLLTLPTDAHCLVEETPPYARWAFAMLDSAGPFEQGETRSFYYITLPEPEWTEQDKESWLTKFSYATLINTSIHEAYPGHYIHFERMRHAPSRLSRTFAVYTHYESWAHYVEQMMLDQGYGENDPRLRLAQLAEALIRNCRYICAIKMHTMGMSLSEATHFFMEHAYMDEVTAVNEARRGTHDPGYLNYTLGKLMLLNLLEQCKSAWGESFSLKRFHDEYITYGSPPIPLLRKLLLAEDSEENGVLL